MNKEQVIITIPKTGPYIEEKDRIMGHVSFGVMVNSDEEKWKLKIYRTSGGRSNSFCTEVTLAAIGDIVKRINEIANSLVIVEVNSNEGYIKMEVYDDYRE